MKTGLGDLAAVSPDSVFAQSGGALYTMTDLRRIAKQTINRFSVMTPRERKEVLKMVSAEYCLGCAGMARFARERGREMPGVNNGDRHCRCEGRNGWAPTAPAPAPPARPAAEDVKPIRHGTLPAQILAYLHTVAGASPAAQICKATGKYGGLLKERRQLVRAGMLRWDGGRGGLWRLTPKGRQFAHNDPTDYHFPKTVQALECRYDARRKFEGWIITPQREAYLRVLAEQRRPLTVWELIATGKMPGTATRANVSSRLSELIGADMVLGEKLTAGERAQHGLNGRPNVYSITSRGRAALRTLDAQREDGRRAAS